MSKSTKTTNQPPIILLHGFRGSPLGLAEISQDLEAAGYKVYTPPVPPFGGAKNLNEYSAEQYVQYFSKFITDHKLQDPILIGHSMGSIITAAIAHSRPELIHQKVVLLSPISKRTSTTVNLVSPLASIIPRRLSDYVTTKYLFVPRKDKPLFHKSLQLTHDCSNDCPPSRKELRKVTKFTTTCSVADFPLPDKDILIIAGTKDRLVRQADTRHLAEKLQAKLVLIPNSGHIHNYEKPHETAQAILDFLQH